VRYLSCIDAVPLSHDTRDALALVAVWLSGAAAILCLLTATADISRDLQEFLPASLTLLAADTVAHFLINQQLAATDADTTEYIENHWEKLNIIDWAAEAIMGKVARAAVV
jgi:hypothetical protein